jgi:hypothetical protein
MVDGEPMVVNRPTRDEGPEDPDVGLNANPRNDGKAAATMTNGASRRVVRVLRKAIFVACVPVFGGAVTGCGSAPSVNASRALLRTSTPGCARKPSGTTCYVLFFGNSYTYVNDLPAMVTALAKAGHKRVEAAMVAKPNETLAEHFESPVTAPALRAARWNVVVLQEASSIPAVERYRQTLMYPPARELARLIDAIGAEPMFYLTPAHRDGLPEAGLDSYAVMQSAIDEGYRVIAREMQAAIAPVGYAWAAAVRHGAGPDLWQKDGSHPTVEGTYLTACVFYTSIFQQSPKGLRYYAGLPKGEAVKLQEVASAVVFGDPSMWRIG